MTLLTEFMAIFDVWEVARPYIDMMVTEREMQLIVGMKGQAMTVHQVAELLGVPLAQASEFLQKCYSRCIVDKIPESDVAMYAPADFPTRLNHFAKFENWDDIPVEDRQAIDRRFMDHFIAKHRPDVERKMRGLSAENALPNDTVMLLSEIEEMIDAATHIIVQPCDCRRLGRNCNRPVETCIWMGEGALEALDRGYGRRITRAEAKELVRWADRKGLMHTADSEWRTRGLHAICNCCGCDCYPFRAAQELGSKGVWPKSRYIAALDRERCDLCGACVKRCHFDAFYHDGTLVDVEGKLKTNVLFDGDRCWGCGLCVNTCPSEAIAMRRLAEESVPG